MLEDEGHAKAYSRTSDAKLAHFGAALRVGPKSPANASKMLESGPHYLALFSFLREILDANAASCAESQQTLDPS